MRRDPTHGRIDFDIQDRVEAMQPKSLGQRVALENGMQQLRDRLGCLDGTTACAPLQHTYTWPCSHAFRNDEPRLSRRSRFAAWLRYLLTKETCRG